VCVDALYGDLTYGLGLAEWDVDLTDKFIIGTSKQFDAVNLKEHHCVWFFHNVTDTGMVKQVLAQRGYTRITQFIWYKPNQTVVGPTDQHTQSWEICTTAIQGTRQSVPWNVNDNPRKRHNLIEVDSVTKPYNHTDGIPINVCEKPPAVSRELLSINCKPQGKVVIIGTGSGGDVIGAIEAGLNVVGVEKDFRQFEALRLRLLKLNTQLTLEVKTAAALAADAKTKKKPPSTTTTTTQEAKTTSPTKKTAAGRAISNCDHCGSAMPEDEDSTECEGCSFRYHKSCMTQQPTDNSAAQYKCSGCLNKEGGGSQQSQVL
jgi:hypothetical protein